MKKILLSLLTIVLITSTALPTSSKAESRIVGLTADTSVWTASFSELSLSLQALHQSGVNSLCLELTPAVSVSRLDSLLSLFGQQEITTSIAFTDKEWERFLPVLSKHAGCINYEVLEWDNSFSQQVIQSIDSLRIILKPRITALKLDAYDTEADLNGLFLPFDAIILSVNPISLRWSSIERLSEALPNVFVRTSEVLQSLSHQSLADNKSIILSVRYPRDHGFTLPLTTVRSRDALLGFLISLMNNTSEGEEDGPLSSGLFFGDWSPRRATIPPPASPYRIYSTDFSTLSLLSKAK